MKAIINSLYIYVNLFSNLMITPRVQLFLLTVFEYTFNNVNTIKAFVFGMVTSCFEFEYFNVSFTASFDV